MKAKIINGTEYQKINFYDIRKEITKLKKKYKRRPGIAFVACVGHLPLMKYTIGFHEKTANELGFKTVVNALPHTVKEEALLEVIDNYNNDDSIDAILLLQPVPKHINALRIIGHIDSRKEVEGFHYENIMENLLHGSNKSRYLMCLPNSLLELFNISGIEIRAGQQFVFVADEDFLSDPFRSMILRAASSIIVPSNCARTLVNIEHPMLFKICEQADFIVVISEKPEFFKPTKLKPNVCIVDIYSNLIDEVPSKKDPKNLIPVIKGGVDTDFVMDKAGTIVPCPGGLMPVLLVVLFRNALLAFKYNMNELKSTLELSGIHPYNEILLNTESWKLTTKEYEE